MNFPVSYLQICLLAIIQAFAELLPVSSSAHVIVAEKVMGIDPSLPQVTFLLVMLHTGTMFSVCVFFAKRWIKQLSFALLQAVFFATLVTGAVGWTLKLCLEWFLRQLAWTGFSKMEDLFKSLPLIAIALFAAGIVVFISGKKVPQNHPLTIKKALSIGLVQALCLPFRGFSRSGATISMGLFLGLSYNQAEEFSFLLALAVTPAVILREVYKLLELLAGGVAPWHSLNAATGASLLEMLVPGLVGAGLSFLAGLLSLKWLSVLLEHGKWSFLGIYCFVASMVVFSLHWVLGFGLINGG
jgi:undecaprenyl-diphosphatase